MKHLWIAGLMLFGGMLLAGTDIDVNGKFAGSKVGDKEPKGWYLNTGIQAVGTGKVVQVGDELAVQISSPSKEVHYYTRQLYPVVAGEKYELSCDVVGTGKVGFAMYYYDGTRWSGLNYSPLVTLKSGENDVKFVFTVPAEVNGKALNKVRFAFRVSGACEVTINDLEVEKEDAK